MQLLFLQQWFSEETLKAIGWTLIHSLWQGLLAAVVAGIVIIATRRSPARLRYNLLGAVIILFIMTTVITFTQQIKDAAATGKTFTGTGIRVTETSFDVINYETTSPVALTTVERFVSYFNAKADLFVLIWAIFFFVHCIKLIGGLAGIQRIRNYKTHSSPGEWIEKLEHLSRLIGIKKQVILLQSQLVKVPVAIGFFKPVILVPLGLLSNLPAEQVETILLHELAHIRRNDYLVNIFQRFAEAVFFFNPALLWISSLVRQEREACCDDMVIANTNSKGNYLEALVSFQEYSLASQGYAMAISSKRHYLLNRVRRMITRENKKLNVMEKIVLVMGLIAVTAFTFIPKKEISNKKNEPVAVTAAVQRVLEQKPTRDTASGKPMHTSKRVIKLENKKPVVDLPAKMPLRDTVPGKEKEKTGYNELKFPSISSNINDDGKTKTETTTVTDGNGKKYSYTKLNDKITSLTVDGKTIPQNEFGNYSQLFEQIEKARQENKAHLLLNLEHRKADMMQRREEMKDRIAEKRVLRDIQNAQKQHLLESNKRAKLFDKSRMMTENQRNKMIKLIEKAKKQKMNVPMLNGREIIKNENHVYNSVSANILVNTDINSATKVSHNIKDIKFASNIDMHTKEMHLKSSPDVALKFETNVNMNNTLLKNSDYKLYLKEPKLFQYQKGGPAKPGSPVRKTSNVKPSTKNEPVKPKVKSEPVGKRVTT